MIQMPPFPSNLLSPLPSVELEGGEGWQEKSPLKQPKIQIHTLYFFFAIHSQQGETKISLFQKFLQVEGGKATQAFFFFFLDTVLGLQMHTTILEEVRILATFFLFLVPQTPNPQTCRYNQSSHDQDLHYKYKGILPLDCALQISKDIAHVYNLVNSVL